MVADLGVGHRRCAYLVGVSLLRRFAPSDGRRIFGFAAATDSTLKAESTVFLLFAFSLGLSIFSNNTVDVYSVRHLLIAGLASAVIFGIAIDSLISR